MPPKAKKALTHTRFRVVPAEGSAVMCVVCGTFGADYVFADTVYTDYGVHSGCLKAAGRGD